MAEQGRLRNQYDFGRVERQVLVQLVQLGVGLRDAVMLQRRKRGPGGRYQVPPGKSDGWVF
ncbi:hypothetical protein [Salmonirosea aquatica]|uniref:Uncharacterized protein n=1 Tax=Salmonirosea aquatica TaxID=2654236 RepID=A0A7C9BB18_9BACT|nr:hypothetical protein [Cytophagaceae bacterium SJW1-29]